jgi:CheY-like chemotaxis protein
MVVDAADVPRVAISEYFGARGWDVIPVTDGVEAVTRSLAQPVDVVVMSVNLPGLPGYEAAAMLRQLAPGIRIILTSNDVEPPPRRRRRSQSFRCFPKPLDLDALARAVDEPSGHASESREESR